MGALRGALIGIVAVSALDVAVRTSSGAARLGGAFTGLATAFDYVINPDLPLIPAYYLPNGGGKNANVSVKSVVGTVVTGVATSKSPSGDAKALSSDPVSTAGYSAGQSVRKWLANEF